ncbi:urease accessory protein UreF [Nitrincola tapanii]|uniref:Urease accessory protein UreF n=1 Tax=Nitrincola tapanii TaxID=1708751 RepID=A0A5A9W170_9GAMM|nr:urease accessory UreF family protein [Nitrincola tapanii]KAA0874312.1 urease accessory protein UreF [Nitrincola tapanii]
MLAQLRLFQLISPSLPVGAFTYSQGLEWAVEAGWIKTSADLGDWLDSVLRLSVLRLEVPILLRLHQAWQAQDLDAAAYWTETLYISRETSELRAEETQRGKALALLLPKLGIEVDPQVQPLLQTSQVSGMSYAAQHWQITPESLAQGYLWSWLENAVMAGVKLVPLGQTQGQQLLLEISSRLPEQLHCALHCQDQEIAACTPALAIASARHETQYTRLFRS